jgi:acetyltransferase-like isoleucine patch superfamily enzyme
MTAALALYRGAVRLRSKAFSLLAGRAFAAFGRRTVLELPVRLEGVERIAIGDDVYVGAGSWLQVLAGDGAHVALQIGDGTSIAGTCVLSAAQSVSVGRNVLFARNVYVSDHSHAFDDVTRPVLAQGVDRVAPVAIGDGAWLGQNVVVCPGVRIGRGAVVGANSVVKDDVPDHAVAVGAPARVVKELTAEGAAA